MLQWKSLVILALALVLQGCGTPARGPSFGPASPKLGRELGWGIAPSWSADSREIYSLELWAGGNYGIKAVNVLSGEVRSLTEKPLRGGNTGRNATFASRDGERLYVVISNPTYDIRDELYQVSTGGGRPQRLLSDMAWPLFALSYDEQHVAYIKAGEEQGEDVLVIKNLGTGQYHTVYRGLGPIVRPLEFSPDSRQLVYSVSQIESSWLSVRLFSLSEGTTQKIWEVSFLGYPPSVVAPDLLWVEGRPQLLLVEQASLRGKLDLFRYDGRRRTYLAEVPEAEQLPMALAWSRDGEQIALWTPIQTGPQCCMDGVCISRNFVHWRLYLWTASQKSWSVLADIAACEGASWLAFSPDGRSIAYQLYGKIYVDQLPALSAVAKELGSVYNMQER